MSDTSETYYKGWVSKFKYLWKYVLLISRHNMGHGVGKNISYWKTINDEDDWGEKLELGFNETIFSTDVEDYFMMFEDKCTQSHICAARVSGVLSSGRM